MADIQFEFDKTKAIETLIYIARRIDHPDYGDIFKLMYLADKTSLEKVGRFIFGDTYCAMQYGAVPSNLFDLVKEVKRSGGDSFDIEGYRVKPKREANTDWFSDSDIECLDQIIALYGKAPPWKRIRDTHDEVYDEAWNARHTRDSVPMRVESITGLWQV
jgi:uncharacterized phage-associated protein